MALKQMLAVATRRAAPLIPIVINSPFKVVPMFVPITIGIAACAVRMSLHHYDAESGDDSAGFEPGQ
jgi:hypothetical protein